MGWAAIITVLIELFGPLLAAWLKQWLDDKLKSASTRVAAPETFGSPAAGTSALFDEAIDSLPRLAFARRLLLRRLKAAAVARSGMIFSGASVPPLTSDERHEIGDAAGAAGHE